MFQIILEILKFHGDGCATMLISVDVHQTYHKYKLISTSLKTQTFDIPYQIENEEWRKCKSKFEIFKKNTHLTQKQIQITTSCM